MAGPNVEVFKFGLYMFFPVWIMFKFGDPQWYQDYVQPYKEILFPPYESTNRPPKTQSDLKEEIARLKEARATKRPSARTDDTALPTSTSTPAPAETEAGVPMFTAKSYYSSFGRPREPANPSAPPPGSSATSPAGPAAQSSDGDGRIV